MSNRKFLTDDEIVELIIKYVDETLYDYAVMIDGEWGCGKTYFVKNKLIDKLKKHEEPKNKNEKARKVIYISLYGVKSTDEIAKQILIETYLSEKGKLWDFLRIGNKFLNSIMPFALNMLKAFTGLETSQDNINSIFKIFFTLKRSILIFDDLERCDCSINEILGYINTFVEQSKMKVIIIANQKEIVQCYCEDNRKLKYMTTANSNIDFEQQKNESDKKELLPINIDSLDKRVNKLFGEDILYEKIKEKLIGNIICYRPNLQNVFERLIKKSKIDNNLQKLLLKKCSFFENYTIDNRHQNLRTFQFYLSKINEIYINFDLDSDNKIAFFEYIIEYCFKICVYFKKGILDDKWIDNEEYRLGSYDEQGIFNEQLEFRFVDVFIADSILDCDNIEKMFIIYKNEVLKEKSKELEEFYRFEHSWFVLDEDSVNDSLQRLMTALKDDKYSVDVYDRIVVLLVNLVSAEFSEDILYEAISYMKNNIKGIKKRTVLRGGYYDILENEKKKKKVKEIFKELQICIDECFENHVSNYFQQCLSKKSGWGHELDSYIYKNRYEINHKIGFLSIIDIDLLAKKLFCSNSNDIHDFRRCFLDLYVNGSQGEALENDCELIEELLDNIKNFDKSQFDKIKNMQIKYLIENLEKAISSYA